MTEAIIFVIMIGVLILFKLYKIPEKIEIITTGLIIASTCYYIAITIGDVNLSKIYMILTVLSILLIPFLLVVKYLEKMK